MPAPLRRRHPLDPYFLDLTMPLISDLYVCVCLLVAFDHTTEAMAVLLQPRARHCHTVSLTVILALLAVVCLEQAGGLSVNSLTSTSTSWLRAASSNGRGTTRRRGLSQAENRRDREGGAAVGPTMGIAYNPNDELRAIVQRKQHEVKSLLAAHSSKDDPLQVSTMHHSLHTVRTTERGGWATPQSRAAIPSFFVQVMICGTRLLLLLQ